MGSTKSAAGAGGDKVKGQAVKASRKTSEKPGKGPAQKKAKLIVPVTGDDGWTLHPPSLIYK